MSLKSENEEKGTADDGLLRAGDFSFQSKLNVGCIDCLKAQKRPSSMIVHWKKYEWAGKMTRGTPVL